MGMLDRDPINFFVMWHEVVIMTGGVVGLKVHSTNCSTLKEAEEVYEELATGENVDLTHVTRTEGTICDIHILAPIKSSMYKTLDKIEGLAGDTLLFAVFAEEGSKAPPVYTNGGK